MSLINETLKHFFLKEYAHAEPNKFVHLHKTGRKFDDSMFISPAADEDGKPFFSDAMASAFLSGECDRCIAIVGSENQLLSRSPLSDVYASILNNMTCVKPELNESFQVIKGKATEKLNEDNPVNIVDGLETVPYKTFYTLPYDWFSDNGWQDPAFRQEFSFKKPASPTVGTKPDTERSFWKQSPVLAAFTSQKKPVIIKQTLIASAHRSALGTFRPVSTVTTHSVQPGTIGTITDKDRHKGLGGKFHLPPMGQFRAESRRIISKPENIVIKPVETDSLTIKFFYKIVPVKIPWIHLELFGAIENYWSLPGMETGQLSNGLNDSTNKGIMPSFISDVIIVKDVSISGRFSKNEIKEINEAFGFEAFNLTDKQIPGPQPDGTIIIEDKGKQILGFLCTVFPKSPAYHSAT